MRLILAWFAMFILCLPSLADGMAGGGKTPPGGTNGQLQYNNNGVFGGTTALPNGTTATTQSQLDGSTKVSTTSYTDTAVSNAVAGANPAVAVTLTTNAKLPNSPGYVAGVITSTAMTALVVDGSTPTAGQRILVKNEGDAGGLGAPDNGVYTVTAVGSGAAFWVLTRASDYNTPSNINNTGAIPTVSGTANAVTSWLLTSTVVTVGVDALTYAQFTYAPSNTARLNNSNGFSADQTPATAGSNALGTTALPWLGAYFGNAATNNMHVTGTQTGARKFTFPDANCNPVQPDTGASNNFLTGISSAGVITKAQPSSSNLSDSSGVKAGNFGGDGSGGALTLSATESAIIQYNGTTVSVADGATESLLGPSVINATSTITIGGGASGVMKEAANGSLGASGSAQTASGKFGSGPLLESNSLSTTTITGMLTAGAGGLYATGGGGGGGGGGWTAGGAAGASGGGGGAGIAGLARSFQHGSFSREYCGAGGGGGAGGQGTASGVGGNGGGELTLCAVGNISVAAGAVLSCDGQVGTTPAQDATGHGAGGSGGGGGGFLKMYSLALISSAGTTRANGGAGGTGGAAKAATNGNGGGGGGGGGCGILVRMSTTTPTSVGTVTANGGALGSGGAKDGAGTIGANGVAGTNGTPLAITGTPNLPLIVMHQKWIPGVMEVIAQAHCNGEREYFMTATENSSLMAACETAQKYSQYVCTDSNEVIHGPKPETTTPENVCFMQMNSHLLSSTEWVPNNLAAILADPDKVQAKLDNFTCQTLENPEHGLYCGGLEELVPAA